MPQLPKATRDPLGHYCRIGWREGRDPGPWFSTLGYLNAHTDVAHARINPLLHFVQTGQWEGRWPAGLKPNEHDRFPRVEAPKRSGIAVSETAIAFLVDLVQDVSVLRPLVLMAAKFDAPIIILLSGRFAFLDRQGTWQDEVAELAEDTGATVLIFGSAEEAARALPERGLLFSASESSAAAHSLNHMIFTRAPADLHKVTVQHGFECLGFRHNREHDRAHGESIHFAADSVCAWYARPALTAFALDGDADLVVTGPTSLLPCTPARSQMVERDTVTQGPGLVCENLHSVRYSANQGLVEEFIQALSKLAASEHGRAISLRPHPAGAFIQNNNGRLPGNVRVKEGPLWKIGLKEHAYAICSASSFAIDAILAGIPTAIWQDDSGLADTSAFDGLPKVSSPDEWIAFALQARVQPLEIVTAQNRWLDTFGFVTDPLAVNEQFARLFGAFVGKVIVP